MRNAENGSRTKINIIERGTKKMSDITITNLNKIISDYKKKSEVLKAENLDMKDKVKVLEKELVEAKRRR